MIEIGDIIKWEWCKWNAIYGLVINKTVDIITIKWFKDGSLPHDINSSLVNNHNFVVISK